MAVCNYQATPALGRTSRVRWRCSRRSPGSRRPRAEVVAAGGEPPRARTVAIPAATLRAAAAAEAVAGRAVLYRDVWGVPHVYAAREEDGYFGLGYAQAEDQVERLLTLVRLVPRRARRARGRERSRLGRFPASLAAPRGGRSRLGAARSAGAGELPRVRRRRRALPGRSSRARARRRDRPRTRSTSSCCRARSSSSPIRRSRDWPTVSAAASSSIRG